MTYSLDEVLRRLGYTREELEGDGEAVLRRVQQIVDNYDALDYRKQRAVNIAEIIHQLREALKEDR